MQYSVHARERMIEYGIAEAEVQAVIDTHRRGLYTPQARDRVEHFGYAADGSPLNVVTNRAVSVVITIVLQ